MVKPEDFAILPWNVVSGSDQVYEQIKACGFNLAGFVPPGELDRVSRAGLKAIVFDPSTHVSDYEAALDDGEIERRVKALVRQVGGYPSVFGYYLRDEPGSTLFQGLSRWKAAYKTAAPQALAYINLFPNYASQAQMGAGNYDAYIETYIETVHPDVICYDHYAMMDDGSIRDGYFQNLETVRSASQRHDLPFWNIVLGNAHFHYAEPSPATLRFQLYTSLAYGARGISYFTYFAPSTGNYRLAPIDQFGHQTPTWDMLRNVNLQIQNLGPAYVTLKNKHVFHHPEIPPGSAGLETSSLVARLEGGQLLVGEFTSPHGGNYVLVVNKDLQRSTSFDIELKQPGPIQLLNAYTGQPETWSGEQNWLAPGQGMLLFTAPAT